MLNANLIIPQKNEIRPQKKRENFMHSTHVTKTRTHIKNAVPKFIENYNTDGEMSMLSAHI